MKKIVTKHCTTEKYWSQRETSGEQQEDQKEAKKERSMVKMH